MTTIDLTRINVTHGGTTQHYPITSWKGSVLRTPFTVPASDIGEFEATTLNSDDGDIPATRIKIGRHWTNVVETPAFIKKALKKA